MDLKYIVAALRHCRKLQAPKHGKSFHSHLIKTGFSPSDVYMMNNLISMYTDCSLLIDARNLFDEMPVKNIVTWTSMVHACTTAGMPHDAINLYREMLAGETETPTGFTYSAVLKACSMAGDVELGKLIHDRIIEQNLEEDVVLMNTLLHMYVKCDRLRDARDVFEGMMSKASTTSWNTIISGYCKQGLMKEAVDLFRQMPNPNVVSFNTVIAGLAENGNVKSLEFLCRMHSESFNLDEFTFPCALKICGEFEYLAMGKQIHCYALKSGFENCSYTLSALLDMYSNSKSLDEAVKLFEMYSNNEPSLAFWNSMVSGYLKNEKNVQALNLVSYIHSSGISLDSYTWSNALKVCINLLNFKLGVQVHGLVVITGYEMDCVVGSILTDLYAKLGEMKDAFAVFGKLPEKDNLAWSGLITGCAKAGLNMAAFSLFRDMVSLEHEIDQFVIATMLKVCSSVSSLGKGRQIHALCIKEGYETESVTATALIDMYSKCGQIEESISLFNRLGDRDVVCWTGIIVGCGQNGKVNEALEIFREMKRCKVEPNEVTFLGVLAACRHAGLVETGWSVFQSMKSDHGLEPQVEHYFCMVDLLGQAGFITEAVDLVSEMPFRANKTIWSSLLAACVTHKKSEMVGGIAENLCALFPEDPSVYVMVSNCYAALGMWDDLSRVREAAKTSGIKESGRSWIEVSA
ncbi:Pentatricopeptide repeat-containing protein At4g08210 [Linum grandiflorum]